MTAPAASSGHAYSAISTGPSWFRSVIGGLVGGSMAPPVARRISSPGLVTLLAIALIAAAAGLVLRQ